MERSVNNRQELFCTTYKIAINKELLLSRRPCEPAAGQEMEMNVKHRLPGTATVIDDHPVPALFKPLPGRYGSGDKKHVADELTICHCDTVNICDMLLGDDERMDWRLRVYVFKCYGIIILMDYL